MNLQNLSVVIVFLMSLAFGLSGCGEWKSLGHSVGQHSQHHHGTGAKQHKADHPFD